MRFQNFAVASKVGANKGGGVRGGKAAGGVDNTKHDCFNPMLAFKLEPELFGKLRWPLLLSPKLDGIRATGQNCDLLSRRLKLIPNRYTQARFALPEYDMLDGELILGPPTSPTVYHDTDLAVTTHAGEPDVMWHLFDEFGPGDFEARHQRVIERARDLPNVVIVPHKLVRSVEEMLHEEDEFLDMGFEGICLRDPRGPYKQGRSTMREGWLIKFKRFLDAEAIVTGTEELFRNENEAEIDERGYTTRSRRKEGMVPGGVLGKLLAEDKKNFPGHVLKIGTGFSAIQREMLWKDRANLIGKQLKYGYTPVGVKDKPRFPKFLGWRSKID